MVYDPTIGALKCQYCDAMRTIDKRISFKRDYEKERLDGEVKFDDATYKCPNCAGEMKLSPFDTAVKCPYCGATNVIKLEDLKGLKPDSILPFALSKQQASDAGKKWIKRHIFVPNKLTKDFSIKHFNGVYIPSYAFTTDTESFYEGRFGERHTRVVGSGKNSHVETYVEWEHRSGTYRECFRDMAVEASTQLTQKELNKILPYDTDNLEAYNDDYISGFGAERYDTSLTDGFDIAKKQMSDKIRKKIIAKEGADEVDYLNVDTKYDNTRFNYMLLPLWVCAYVYKKKGYRFIINGRTGKSTGKVPVSPLKVCFTVLSVLAAIALITFLIISQ